MSSFRQSLLIIPLALCILTGCTLSMLWFFSPGLRAGLCFQRGVGSAFRGVAWSFPPWPRPQGAMMVNPPETGGRDIYIPLSPIPGED